MPQIERSACEEHRRKHSRCPPDCPNKFQKPDSLFPESTLLTVANQIHGKKRKKANGKDDHSKPSKRTFQKAEKAEEKLFPLVESFGKKNFTEDEQGEPDWDDNINLDLQLEVDPNLEDPNLNEQSGDSVYLSSYHWQQLKDLKEIQLNTHTFEKLKDQIFLMREEITAKDNLISTLISEKESLLQEKKKLLGFIQDIQRDCTTIEEFIEITNKDRSKCEANLASMTTQYDQLKEALDSFRQENGLEKTLSIDQENDRMTSNYLAKRQREWNQTKAGTTTSTTYLPLKKVLTSVLNAIIKKDSLNLFYHPAEHSLESIGENLPAMCFSLMKRKLQNNDYSSLDSFRLDFDILCKEWISWKNGMYCEEAKKMWEEGNLIIENHLDKIDPMKLSPL